MKAFLPLITVLFIGCNDQPGKPAVPTVKIDTTYAFKDSTSIGIAKKHKVEVYRFVINDSISEAEVLFFQKEDTGWLNISTFRTEQWRDDLAVEISDFNNDGDGDLVYVKGNGARGGNRIMQLFIFKPMENSLTYIKNATDYPNLYYNKETNTINSYILTGCSITMFLELAGAELKPIASVEQCAGSYIVVSEYNSVGKSHEILRKKDRYENPFTQFTNYRPLTVDTGSSSTNP